MTRGLKNEVSGLTAFFVLAISAFLTRLLPLYFSSYPFNNDALFHCGMSADIVATGHLEFSDSAPWAGSHSSLVPAINILIAFFASSLGTSVFDCAQPIIAVLSVLTVSSVFVLGMRITGSTLGGIASALTVVLMGTFVFTTGSVWGVALGIPLFCLSVFTYVYRKRPASRVVTFTILMVLPFVHHLVAFVALATFSNLVIWSFSFALASGTLGRRHWLDLATVGIPLLCAPLYYVFVSFSRLSKFSSTLEVMILVSVFLLLCLVSVTLLMPRRHTSLTFAPVVSIALILLLLADYSGCIFSYVPSAPILYLLLILALGIVVGVSWYGAEMILVSRPMYKAIPVALLMAPLTLIIFALLRETSLVSFQLVYRTFDFFDIFLSVGAGAAVVVLKLRRDRVYRIVSLSLVAALAISFPFGYWTDELLGVRHDTQEHEVDALRWIRQSSSDTRVISDERLTHIANSMFWFTRDSGLPMFMTQERSIDPSWTCMAEVSWTESGVNVFPFGKKVIPRETFDKVLLSSNVLYIGGPIEDYAVIFVGSPIGSKMIYGA